MVLITLFIIDHNFWTQNLSKSIKVLKDSDFRLVSNKNLSDILPSSGLGLEPDEVDQNDLKQIPLMVSLTKKRETQNKKNFSLKTWRLAESFEGLNSSLAQLSAEIFPRKNMCKLLDFSLRLTEDKVLKYLETEAQTSASFVKSTISLHSFHT